MASSSGYLIFNDSGLPVFPESTSVPSVGVRFSRPEALLTSSTNLLLLLLCHPSLGGAYDSQRCCRLRAVIKRPLFSSHGVFDRHGLVLAGSSSFLVVLSIMKKIYTPAAWSFCNEGPGKGASTSFATRDWKQFFILIRSVIPQITVIKGRDLKFTRKESPFLF